ncbi:MAG: cupin domain-containing protein [Prolixibacteraceae bacterium]|jgi:mannose-6-phosphate isomerase-like protein (cupin superfamily)|nr:cupin domain-containing protein [Prolixibacteraceae bacterium]
MPVLFKNQGPAKDLLPGVKARIATLDKLMTLVSEISFGVLDEPLPLHTHPSEQMTFVLEGELNVVIEGEETQHLKPGDLFYVPSNVPHAIQTLSEKVRVLECFTPLREDLLKK